MEPAAPTPAMEVPGNSVELQAVIYTTPRLLCRRIQSSDAEDIFLIRSNPSYTQFFTYPSDPNISVTMDYINQRASNPLAFTFSITLRTPESAPAPKVIGLIGGTKLPEIGHGLNETYWGRGYASEALDGFLRMYWERFPQGYPGIKQESEKHLLKATSYRGNVASRRVLAKAGFREIGEVEVRDYTKERKIMLDGWVIKRPEREEARGEK